jgi:hypothetical protein
MKMSETTIWNTEIVVVANGYKIRQPFHPSGMVYNESGEFVFSTLDELFDFLRERLAKPTEKE